MFDSGIGGLSIARCVAQNLPNEQLIYVADSGFAPYGDKSHKDIIARADVVANFLIAQGVKAIVVACNTATVVAIEALRAKYALPIIGVEPAIKPAAKQSTSKSVGILVTQATAKNARFLALIDTYKQAAQVHIQPCPGLVQQIEQGQHHSDTCHQLLDRFIAPLVAKQIDTLVLGCTHYPLIETQIKAHLPEGIALVETAQPVTNELIRRLSQFNLLTARPNASKPYQVYSSALTEIQQQVIRSFWPSQLSFHQL
ncbi:glutamate racemase [Thalassotalea euphylliae]|uniref:Glutamate racemase n=1 Tax=Thalassotalea euphylliae TaxID=1655234 RepID=A0A3E0TWB6_9GAMM|nr:glutamate racemase [Thalassotalea euphylliae]